MTSSLRVRASIVLLLGTLLIPVATSSLRGLTHVLSCQSPVSARFDVAVPTQASGPEAVLLEPTQVTRPDHITRPAPGLDTTTTAADDGGHVTRPAATSASAPGSTAPDTTAPAATSTAPTTTVAGAVLDTTPPETVTVPRPTTTVPRRKPKPVCGGITVDMRLSAPSPGSVRVDLPVTNSGHHNWKGTIRLRVASKVFPVELGSIPPGQTRSKSIEVKVDTRVERVTGDLLLGP